MLHKLPDLRRKTCKGGCGRTTDEVGPLSWEGLCPDCGDARRVANIRDLMDHSGPWFDHWRRSMAATVLPPAVIEALESAGFLESDLV